MTLLSTVSKVLARILLYRLKPAIDKKLRESSSVQDEPFYRCLLTESKLQLETKLKKLSDKAKNVELNQNANKTTILKTKEGSLKIELDGKELKTVRKVHISMSNHRKERRNHSRY